MGSVSRLLLLLVGVGVLGAMVTAQTTSCASDTEGARGAAVACVTGEGVQVRPVGESAPVPGAPPLTPEQKPATPPTVTYENGKLTIVAKNAVLKDILNAVADKTGASIDVPEDADERVVSQLGPGPARDVIAALLNGSHFNYVMVGSEDSPNSVAHVIVTAKAEKDTPKAPAQGPVVAGARPQPRSTLGQTVMQPYQAMLEQQQAQQLQTPDFQAQAQPQPPAPSQAQTASSEEPVAAANPEGTLSPSSPSAASPSAASASGAVAPSVATGPTGTESASIAETPVSAGEPARDANAADRSPQQVLQGLYEARRKMIEAQRQPPPPPSQ